MDVSNHILILKFQIATMFNLKQWSWYSTCGFIWGSLKGSFCWYFLSTANQSATISSGTASAFEFDAPKTVSNSLCALLLQRRSIILKTNNSQPRELKQIKKMQFIEFTGLPVSLQAQEFYFSLHWIKLPHWCSELALLVGIFFQTRL